MRQWNWRKLLLLKLRKVLLWLRQAPSSSVELCSDYVPTPSTVPYSFGVSSAARSLELLVSPLCIVLSDESDGSGTSLDNG